MLFIHFLHSPFLLPCWFCFHLSAVQVISLSLLFLHNLAPCSSFTKSKLLCAYKIIGKTTVYILHPDWCQALTSASGRSHNTKQTIQQLCSCLYLDWMSCVLIAGFEVLPAVVLNVTLLWDIAPCSPYVNRRFGSRWRCKFFRNVGSHTDYTTLYPRRWQYCILIVQNWKIPIFHRRMEVAKSVQKSPTYGGSCKTNHSWHLCISAPPASTCRRSNALALRPSKLHMVMNIMRRLTRRNTGLGQTTAFLFCHSRTTKKTLLSQIPTWLVLLVTRSSQKARTLTFATLHLYAQVGGQWSNILSNMEEHNSRSKPFKQCIYITVSRKQLKDAFSNHYCT
jgi:hypothetical protein